MAVYSLTEHLFIHKNVYIFNYDVFLSSNLELEQDYTVVICSSKDFSLQLVCTKIIQTPSLADPVVEHGSQNAPECTI